MHRKYQNKQGGFVPLGVLIGGLVALGLIGGGVAYQYQKKTQNENRETIQNQIRNQGNRYSNNGARAARGPRGNTAAWNDIQNHIQLTGEDTITDTERESLQYMREEEKLARDVYLTLGEKWGNQIFSNIAGSEERHTFAIKALLDRYGISDPVTDDSVGVFKNETLKSLYTDLVTQGSASELDALKVGATIEDLDIKDLQEALAETTSRDVRTVYENLMRGSRNHLRSFVGAIRAMGGDYEPQFISKKDFDAILSSEMERGRDANHSQGQRMGQGQGHGQGMMHGNQQKQNGTMRGQGHGRGMGRGRGIMR